MTETPAYVVWEYWQNGEPENVPARWVAGEAWAYIGGTWKRVDSTDVGVNGKLVDESTFKSAFANLTALPATAFQSDDV